MLEKQSLKEKRKLENNTIESNRQTDLTLPYDLWDLIAKNTDSKSLLNLSYTCSLFYKQFSKSAYLSLLSDICEEKPTQEEQHNVDTLKKLYTMHSNSIKKARDNFFEIKKLFSPDSNLDLGRLKKENIKLYRNINAIMISIANHGYFGLLAEITNEMENFQMDEFANQNEEKPFFTATMYGYEKTFGLISEKGGDWFCRAQLEAFYPFIHLDPLHNLALFGHRQYLTLVYDHILEGSDRYLPDACTDVIYGKSFKDSYPIMKESYDPNDPISLIDYVNNCDDLGWSALHWAACLGNMKLLQEAVELMVDVNTFTSEGVTALHLACIRNHPDCVRYLLAQGAKLETIKGVLYCDHPLQMAVYYDSTEVLVILLEYMKKNACDINYADDNQDTSLHIACRENRPNCVRLLIAAGIDLELTNYAGKTSFAIAEEENNADCVEILRNEIQSSITP